MRRPLLYALIVLACAAPASAHTDGGPQLSFVWPATGTVTSPFGERRAGGFHPGVDIGILESLTVRAAAPGRVTMVGEPTGYEGYGGLVAVDVGGGFTTLYAHLAGASVRAGDWVTQGQQIATAGCTGWCTGTHLHFELRQGARPIDPTPLIVG